MKYVFCLIIAFALSMSSWAQDSKRESVEELLRAANMDSMMESMYAQIDQMFTNMGQELGIQSSGQETFDNYILKVAELMRQEMSWEEMREPMIDIYLVHYSEGEIQDMLSFYRSETGQSMVDKMPAVMADSMKLSQEMMIDFMPKVQALVAEFQEELQSKRNSK